MTSKRAVFVVLLALLVVLAPGCGVDEGDKPAADAKKSEPALSIRLPKDGEAAECPVSLRVKARRLTLLGAPAGSGTEAKKTKDRLSARIHGLVDRAALAAGAAVPKANGSTVIDFDRGRASVAKLAAGEHKVVVIAASADRKVLDPVLTDAVTFKVEKC